MMKKFPVTSDSGKEYLVRVRYTDSMFFGEGVLYVELQIKKGKTIFGRDKFIEVDTRVFEKNNILNTDIIGAVKKAVVHYEKQVYYKENVISQSKKDFLEWNGDC